MVYSKQRGVVFIKTVKTGGTSMQAYLAWKLGLDAAHGDLVWGPPHKAIKNRHIQEQFMDRPDIQEKIRGWGAPEHRTALMTREVLGHEEWDRCLSVACMRNPWDRLRSAWWFFRRGNGSFEQFVRNRCQARVDEPYLGQLQDPDCNEIVRLIFRYDHFHQGLRYVCEHAGLEHVPEEVPYKKAGARKDRESYHHYYSPELRDLVGEAHHWELETLGFKFEDQGGVQPADAPIDTSNWYLDSPAKTP